MIESRGPMDATVLIAEANRSDPFTRQTSFSVSRRESR